jgi:translation initiation factor IF-2
MRFLAFPLLALAASLAMAADGPAPKTTPLDVKPVVLPTPEVQTQPLSAAPDAPSAKPGAKPAAKAGAHATPKAAAKKAKPAPKKAVKKVAKKPTKKAARR